MKVSIATLHSPNLTVVCGLGSLLAIRPSYLEVRLVKSQEQGLGPTSKPSSLMVVGKYVVMVNTRAPYKYKHLYPQYESVFGP